MSAIPQMSRASQRHLCETEGPYAERRYYDKRMKATIVRVFQGDYYLTTDPKEIITSILGSCVAVCVRDPVVRCGGMNHFLLPDACRTGGGIPDLAMRYGSFSIERLINDILNAGGKRERLEAKVFGGANVLRGMSQIGFKNADFVERYLENEGIAIAAQALRGVWPRQIRFYPTTGLVKVRELKIPLPEIFKEEENLRRGPGIPETTGDVELFD